LKKIPVDDSLRSLRVEFPAKATTMDRYPRLSDAVDPTVRVHRYRPWEASSSRARTSCQTSPHQNAIRLAIQSAETTPKNGGERLLVGHSDRRQRDHDGSQRAINPQAKNPIQIPAQALYP